MDRETADYIINFYANLLTTEEKLAIKHTHSTIKLGLDDIKVNNPSAVSVYKKHGWLTENENILDLLQDGYDTFAQKTAQRILIEKGDEVFLNNCPKCGKLARTPFAKQCRFCQSDWH